MPERHALNAERSLKWTRLMPYTSGLPSPEEILELVEERTNIRLSKFTVVHLSLSEIDN